ncbi:MAG: Crp/Fnr family transcriptional regulator [Pricia sp.]
MKELLFKTIYNHPQIKLSDLNLIMDVHEKVYFSKGDFLLQVGAKAAEYFIVEKGLMRSFVYDTNGNDITTDFFGEGDIAIEVSSLFMGIPSQENIQTLTEGHAWKITFDDFQNLFHTVEGISEWGRAWFSQQLFSAKQRSIDMITKSAPDRYLYLEKNKPQIIKNAPLKHIASYLGVTDTSLSRIRKEIHSN